MKHTLYATHLRLIGFARMAAVTAALVTAVQLLLLGSGGATLDHRSVVVVIAACWVAAERWMRAGARQAARELSRRTPHRA